ncbi:hypothetical protein V5O48_016251 [Marasmius crinis-equi]|uniref:Uncharacterized protein n=1 Tax=Marasmius crinis-equi TaxID=585013 RepID=A0ABR3ESD9_9AGAR
MPRANTKTSKSHRYPNHAQNQLGHTKTKLENEKAQRTGSQRVFVPSLLPKHWLQIKALLFSEFYEFLHNDMIPAGINWIFHQLECQFPDLALYPAGSVTEVEDVIRIRKEDICLVLYKAFRDTHTYPDGTWMPFAPLRILELKKQISREDYMYAGMHSMRWRYGYSAIPKSDYFSTGDAKRAMYMAAPSAYHVCRVRKTAETKWFFLKAHFLPSFDPLYYDN